MSGSLTTGQFVHAEGADLHFRRAGQGRPILLLHGVTDSGACWARVAGALADPFDVVATDARGHGLSSRIEGDFSIAELARDAAEVIRAVFGGPVPVWGHSMGAATAALLAAEHLDLVTAVVLEDPPFMTAEPDPEEVDLDAVVEGIRRMVHEVRDTPVEGRLAFAQAANPDWDASELDGWVESKLDFDDSVLGTPITEADWRDTAQRIQAPVLLVTGDPARGAIVTPDAAAAFAALHADTRIGRFDAGHNVHREAYETVLDAVRAFLDEHA